jgi:hypothetical protein
MRRTSLDEAVTAAFIRARHAPGQPEGEGPPARPRQEAPPSPRVLPLSEIAQLEGLIKLQQSAQVQHQSAVRHWLASGDQQRADDAAWREDYVGGLLVQLRSDLADLKS